MSTGANATQVCVATFGRDEGGGGFAFTQKHIDFVLKYWSEILMGVGYIAKITKPMSGLLFELCISDSNKSLLFSSKEDVILFLINGLFLDPAHPRADLSENDKRTNQEDHVGSIAQLALFPPSREALQQDQRVQDALQTVAQYGLSGQARESAEAALMALSDEELQIRTGGQKHVMLSYQVCDCYPSGSGIRTDCLLARLAFTVECTSCR
jgi:hypothetical protein